jgi:hypothetical protein
MKQVVSSSISKLFRKLDKARTRLIAYAVRFVRNLIDVLTIIKTFRVSSGLILFLILTACFSMLVHGDENMASNGLVALSPLITGGAADAVRDEAERNSKVKDEEIELGGLGVHAWLYIRVSTWIQALMGLSPSVQLDRLLPMKGRMEVLPFRLSILVDKGKSGFSSQRKIFTAIARELKDGCSRPHEIWVTSVDRLGRDAWFLLGFFVFFLCSGGKIRTPDGVVYSRDDPWSLGRFCLEAIGADLPTRNRIDNSKKSKEKAFYERREWNISVPFGFERVGNWIRRDSSPLICDSVVFIFETFARVKNIPDLNEALYQKFHFELNEDRLLRMLANTVYVGRTDPYRTGRPVVDESLRFPGISDELFATVQAILMDSRKKHRRRDEYDTQQVVFENQRSFWKDFVPWMVYHAKTHGGPIVPYGGGTLSGPPELRARCMGTDPETGRQCGVQCRLPKRSGRGDEEGVEWTELFNLSDGGEKPERPGKEGESGRVGKPDGQESLDSTTG